MKVWYCVLYCVIWPFFNLIHPCRAIGRENIPEGAALFCPNHTSLTDPLFAVFAMHLKNRPQVMAKAEIMEVPVLGWILKKAGVFAVERGKSDVGAIKRALKCLKSGEKLLLFPEGTRSKTGELGPAKGGAAMLAVRTGVPIVPMYIPAEKKWFRRTSVVFGTPYIPQIAGAKGTSEEYEAIAQDLMARIALLKEQAK